MFSLCTRKDFFISAFFNTKSIAQPNIICCLLSNLCFSIPMCILDRDPHVHCLSYVMRTFLLSGWHGDWYFTVGHGDFSRSRSFFRSRSSKVLTVSCHKESDFVITFVWSELFTPRPRKEVSTKQIPYIYRKSSENCHQASFWFYRQKIWFWIIFFNS